MRRYISLMNKKTNIKKLTILSMLLALATVMGYLEAILPINIGIPGVKLGLANIVSLWALYKYGFHEGFAVGLLRVILVSLLFANVSMALYSISGFVVSYVIMWLIKKTGIFGITGVSMIGGITHNMAQLAVALLITDLEVLLRYIAPLVISGVLAGMLVGILASLLYRRFEKTGRYNNIETHNDNSLNI